MKIFLILSVSLFVFSMTAVSAKETSALMLTSVSDHAFSTHISVKQNVATTDQAMFADSLRVLAVDISLNVGSSAYPVALNSKQGQ